MRPDGMTARFGGAQRVLRRRAVDPVVELLRVGATPHKLAWSLAVGCTLGVCPLLGATTLMVLVVVLLFRLNLVASQIANYLMYPVQIVLFFVFIRLGGLLFRTEGLPMSRVAMVEAIRMHPWETTRLLWMWEWHGIVVWLMAAVLVTPCLAAALRPLLRRLLRAMPVTRA